MSDELARDPYSVPAAYWARGGARASAISTGPGARRSRGGSVPRYVGQAQRRRSRADLDRLVQQAIIPERVRQMAAANHDADQAAARLRAEWDQVKQWP